MKSTLTLALLLFFISQCFSQTVISIEAANFSRGTIYEKEVKVAGQLFDGIIQESYANGLPKSWVSIKAGRAHGEWIEWYPNGNYRFRSFWKNGMGHGPWYYYYESGTLRQETFYIKDLQNGAAHAYYENGTLKETNFYIDNQKIAKEYQYRKNGALDAVNNYEEGELLNDQPRKFAPGIISTSNYNEWGLTFLPDQNTLYFTRRMAEEKQKIYKSTKVDGKWTMPKLSEINLDRDEAVFYSAVNNCFYFASTKQDVPKDSLSPDDMNIWSFDAAGVYVKLPFNKDLKLGDTWPQHYETGPVTDEQGNIYFWSGSKNGKDADLYLARKSDGFKTAEPLGETVNTAKYESGPALSPDGQYLFFASYQRDDGLGEEDIYYCKKVAGKWSQAKSLGPIVNTRFNESMPSFSPDGQQFYFSSDREGNDKWSIYFMDTQYLGLD